MTDATTASPDTICPAPFAADADIARIGRGLFDRTLPKTEWTHAAHFAAAIWVIAARPDFEASRDMPPAIRAYNAATGVPNTDNSGYHETITQASILAAAAFVRASRGEGLAATCNRLLASPLGQSGWLLQYWSAPVLFSAAARSSWVAPDLAALPFTADPTAFARPAPRGQG